MKSMQRNAVILFVLLNIIFILCLPLTGTPYVDYNNDNKTDLTDAIIALQTVAGYFNVTTESVFSFNVAEISGHNQYNVPVSVTCNFEKGQIQPDTTLIASLYERKRSDSTNLAQMIPIETYDDGSVSQAEVTVILQELIENEEQNIQILSTTKEIASQNITLDDVLQSDFDAFIRLSQNSQQFQLNIRDLLQHSDVETYISGPIFSEFHVTGALSGFENISQNVMADVTIRMFKGLDRCRLYVVLENKIDQIQGGQNYVYDLNVQAGDSVYVRKNVALYPGTTIPKFMWWGPPVYVHISDNYIDEKLITSLQVETNASDDKKMYPVTIGHVFKKRAVPKGYSIKGVVSDTTEKIDVQVDAKTTYDDGSLKHGILSFFVPASTENRMYDIQLISYRKVIVSSEPAVMLSDFLNSDFNCKLAVSIDDTLYQVSLKDVLSENVPEQWLKGSIVSEWLVSSPLYSDTNATHPLLNARFSIRAYNGLEDIRVSTTLENNWTYQENPQNLMYNADIYANDQLVFSLDNLRHFHHSRWRKVFYWQKSQDSPLIRLKEPVHVKHNIRYLIGTKAIPNFNPDFIDNISENAIQEMVDKWENSTHYTDSDGNPFSLTNNHPMGIGVVYAGTTSGDMWPLPYWTGRYLLSMDHRAKEVSLGTADLAGSFPIHFRDQETNLPVSIHDYPYCSTYWQSAYTLNPATGQYENPVKCDDAANDCWVPFSVSTNKMPAYTYVPYMVTGDHYFLEELHFWANYCFITKHPNYREFNNGLLVGDLVDQAMSLGILGRTVFITPDNHPLKPYFSTILENNRKQIFEQNVENQVNSYGGMQYSNKLNPRGNDYYTFSINSLVEMGFETFKPILEWNARYPVARMDNGENFCWIFAATELQCKDTGAMYQTMAEVYQKNKEAGKIDDGAYDCASQALADYLKVKGKISNGLQGEMVGTNDSVYGYIANMQPALAAAVDARINGAEDAWNRYNERPIKPDYIGSAAPNFDIVPRKMTFAKTDLPKGSIGIPYSFKFEVNSGEAPFYWKLTDNGLPQELALDPSGYLSGIPSQAGEYTFSIQVTDDIQTIIQKTLVLKIIDPEVVPFLYVSLRNITYPDHMIGEKSYAEHIAITNTGREPLYIDSITSSSVFSHLHNCPSQLFQGDSCRISVFFEPTSEQKFTGSLTIKSNAENGDQIVTLTGNGVTIPPEKELGIMVKSINFGKHPLSVKTMDSTVWLSDNSFLPIQIQDIRLNGDGFVIDNQCGEIIYPGNQCAINVAFIPESSGNIAAELIIESNADDAPHIIPLQGIGDNSATDTPVCELILENLYDQQLVNQPVTIGHAFAQGDIPAGKTIRMSIGNHTIPVQVEHKAMHPDGSLKHGILSFFAPEISAHSTLQIQLFASHQTFDQQMLNISDLLATSYDAKLTVILDGQTYMASARQLLNSTPQAKQWISGPICTEWLINSPLKDSAGNAHPHLTARFEVRAYDGMENIRSSITLENNWTFQSDPHNLTYHVMITFGDDIAWEQPTQVHFNHARWRKIFWWNKQKGLDHPSRIHVRHDTRYFIATKAIPNFDTQYIGGVHETYLNDMETKWTQSVQQKQYTFIRNEPMSIGFATAYMADTGGHRDLGPIPRWTSRYLMSMDYRAKKVDQGQADLAGSWSIHLRDKNTDLPVSIEEYPYCGTAGRKDDYKNPQTNLYENPAECEEGRDCKSPYSPDISHQPSFAYIPYIVSGDFYHLEEMQFWANYCVTSKSPSYREFEKGLLKYDQLRAQAWALRNIGDAAYITPDDHPMKSYFIRIVDNNLDYYNETYTNNENAINKLGWICPVIAKSRVPDGVIIAPWMDDFVTFAVGHLVELGFQKAEPFLAWKSRFPVGRMIGDNSCWIFASAYRTIVSPSWDDAKAGIYFQTYDDIYNASLAWRENKTRDIFQEILNLECNSHEMTNLLVQNDILSHGVNGEMIGYTDDIMHGYQVILKTALAYALDSGAPGANEAWTLIQGRAQKPDFNHGACYQWTILPRSLNR
jgi:hypothetical protein